MFKVLHWLLTNNCCNTKSSQTHWQFKKSLLLNYLSTGKVSYPSVKIQPPLPKLKAGENLSCPNSSHSFGFHAFFWGGGVGWWDVTCIYRNVFLSEFLLSFSLQLTPAELQKLTSSNLPRATNDFNGGNIHTKNALG